MTSTPTLNVNERAVVLLVMAIQFVNLLEFLIVMPLGPDFAADLGIPTDRIGFIAGAYTIAAAAAGIAGSFFLDRFDRRKVLAVTMAGLGLATIAAGLAWDLYSLIAARLMAGIFGGPATAMAMAVISDVVPLERRGRAMGTVMAAFSLASIGGVPFALELANIGNWRTPFYVVGGMGLAVTAASVFLLPPLRIHLDSGHGKPPGFAMFRLLTRRLPVFAYCGTVMMVMSAFLIIPHIPGYLIFNLGYEGEPWLERLFAPFNYTPSVLGPLYLFGGTLSLVIVLTAGRMTDRLGSAGVSWIGAVCTVIVMYLWFINHQAAIPSLLLFVMFMGSMSIRGVPVRTLDTKVPAPNERAAYMSLQSAIQHVTLSLAAAASSLYLTERPDKSLEGMPVVGWTAVGFALMLPVVVTITERILKRQQAREAQPLPPAAPVTHPAPPAK
jgi:predicted MFS family arabinose efflux permease